MHHPIKAYIKSASTQIISFRDTLVRPLKSILNKRPFRAPSKNLEEAVAKQRQIDAAVSGNPYLQSRVLWNDLYGGIEKKLAQSTQIIILLSVSLILLIIGFIITSMRSTIQPLPYLIRDHAIITLTHSDPLSSTLKTQLAPYFAERFIKAARSISTDPIVNKQNQVIAFSLTHGTSAQFLKDYYVNHNPSTLSKLYVRNINITSILETATGHLLLRWTERWRDHSSHRLVKSKHYIGSLTYQFMPPSSDMTIVEHNPAGLYITDLSWSAEQPASVGDI